MALGLGLLLLVTAQAAFLRIQDKQFHYGDSQVYLNGINQAWIDYGDDFGGEDSAHGNGQDHFCALRGYLQNITDNGGNTMRMWLHTEGFNNPVFNSSGFVVATDATNTLISDMRRYLHAAQALNVFVFFSLWNGAVMSNIEKQMIMSPGRTQSYVDVVLTPMVEALRNEPALGGWEIMNEPEGSVLIADNPNPCYNTTFLNNTGAGWANMSIPLQDLLRFHNVLAAAIRKADPKVLITTGVWSEHTLTNAFPGAYRQVWTDACLREAGGHPSGVFDFYEVHSYAWKGAFGPNAPFKKTAADYQVDRPILVGEFMTADDASAGMTIQEMYNYVYAHGYTGSWSWMAAGGVGDNITTLAPGIQVLRNEPHVKIQIGGGNLGDCSCSNTAPSGDYTCQQQAQYGKCNESWMKGFCCLSCFGCTGCH